MLLAEFISQFGNHSCYQFLYPLYINSFRNKIALIADGFIFPVWNDGLIINPIGLLPEGDTVLTHNFKHHFGGYLHQGVYLPYPHFTKPDVCGITHTGYLFNRQWVKKFLYFRQGNMALAIGFVF